MYQGFLIGWMIIQGLVGDHFYHVLWTGMETFFIQVHPFLGGFYILYQFIYGYILKVFVKAFDINGQISFFPDIGLVGDGVGHGGF